MFETSCFCGESLSGADLETQVAAAVDHFSDVHSEMALGETSIRNYIESTHRIDGPVDRLDRIGEIVVKPISSEIRDDIIEFFDRRAFADNPGWGMCYCMYHHIGGGPDGEWPQRTWRQNRSDLAERIDSGATTGVVAYVDGVVAGFCNASARAEYPFKSSEDDAGLGSIVCFVVAPPYRGHGVQKELLKGAVAVLRGQGMQVAEAYPIREPESSASAFVGKLSLFEREGFEVVSEEPLRVRRSL